MIILNKEFTEKGNERKNEIYRFLIEYVKENGYAPTMREIASSVGLKSVSSVFIYLIELENDGKIKMKGKSFPRAIKIVGYKFTKDTELTNM